MRLSPIYLIFGLLVIAGATFADARGWTPIRPGPRRVGPRTVRENPGGYRPVYRSSQRYRGGK